MDPGIKIRKYISTQILFGFHKAVVILQIVEVKVICYLALSLPILHTDREIKMQKYASTRILSGVYKTVVGLQIFKGGSNLLPRCTRFLSGIWIEKLKYENMFQPGSYLVFIRQLSTCKLLRAKYVCYPALPGSYLAYRSPY